MSETTVETHELEVRAHWLAWRYDLEEDRVLKVLSGVKSSHDEEFDEGFDDETEEEADWSFFQICYFEPSLEEALLYLRPQVAMQWFESGKYDEITSWLKTTQPLLHGYVRLAHSIDDLAWMEYEAMV